MFSVTSLVLRSRRSLISATGGTASRIGVYVSNPTNRAFFTPHSFVLRYFLSTIPDDDTSGSGSLEKSVDLKKVKMTIKVGDNPINILPEISSVFQAPLSTDSNASSSAKSNDTKRLKPMDRDERMAYLEDMIKTNIDDLRGLSKEIATLFAEQLAIRRIPKARRSDSQLLISIEEVIADMKKREVRLVAEVAKHETELNQLKHPTELVDAPIPAQGI